MGLGGEARPRTGSSIDFEPEDLDIEVPGSRKVVSIGVNNDSVDHPNSMTARGPDGWTNRKPY